MPDIWATEKSVFLKAYFKKIKLTQREIAQKLGVTQQSVNAYLNTKPFGKRSARKWSEVFGFNFDWLMVGAGSMFPEEPRNYPLSEPPKSMVAEQEYTYGNIADTSDVTEAQIKDLIDRLAAKNREQGKEIERNKQRIEELEKAVKKLASQQNGTFSPSEEHTDD